MDHSASRDLTGELRWFYDGYRNALFNQKYYAHRLLTYRKWNLIFELALAAGTSGTIGAWAIWKESVGRGAWAILAGVAALIAVAKPIIQLPKSIERYSKLYVGYNDLYHEFERLVSEVNAEKEFTQQTRKSFRLAVERYQRLALEDDPKPVERLRQRLYDEVNREIPPSKLWMPSPAVRAAAEGRKR